VRSVSTGRCLTSHGMPVPLFWLGLAVGNLGGTQTGR